MINDRINYLNFVISNLFIILLIFLLFIIVN